MSWDGGSNGSASVVFDLEQAIISCVLLGDSQPATTVAEIDRLLGPGYSWRAPKHAVIYDTIREVVKRGDVADVMGVKAALAVNKQLDAAGGMDYLTTIAESLHNANTPDRYCRDLNALLKKEQAENLQRIIAVDLTEGRGLDASKVDRLSLLTADEAAAQKPTGPQPRTISEVRAEIEALGEVERLSTSIPGLDEKIGGGVCAGWTFILAAFTGGGKTTLAIREAIHHAGAGRPVLIVTLELSPGEIVRKIDAAIEGEPPQDLRLWILSDVPLLADILSAVERWLAPLDAGGVPVVVLDYIQLVQSSAQPSREREVALAVQTMSRHARRYGYLFVAAAQLNRQSQEAAPKLHHLRESGAIEQTADLALLLSRDGQSRLHVEIGKARFGGTGAVLDLACDFSRSQLELLTASQTLEPIALKVREYLAKQSGHRAKLRDIIQNIKVPGSTKHPKAFEIIEAGVATNAYSVADSEAFIP